MVKAERQVFQGQAEAAGIEHFTQGSVVENRQVFDEKRISEEWFILSRRHYDLSLLFMPAPSRRVGDEEVLPIILITIMMVKSFLRKMSLCILHKLRYTLAHGGICSFSRRFRDIARNLP